MTEVSQLNMSTKSGTDTPTNRSWYTGGSQMGGGDAPVTSTPVVGRSRQNSMVPPKGPQSRKSSQQTESDWGGLDQGIITEIKKLREFMRLEKLMQERGGREPTLLSEEDKEEAPSETDTQLEEKKFIPGPFHHIHVERELYQQRCAKLQISPVRQVINHTGGANLDLKYHPVGPTGAKAIAAPLLVNTTLVSLNLQGTGIEDAGFQALVDTLTENSFLQELNVSQCQLTVRSSRSIGDLLANNPSIIRLNIGGNNLGDRAAEHLARGIQKMQHVIDLNLSDTGLGIPAGKMLGPAIGKNDTLSILDLSWNHISRAGAVAIAKGIQDSKRLLRVNLAWNGFGHEGAVAMGDLLKKDSKLTHLDISHNRIDDKGVLPLAIGLEKNEDLTHFNMSHNSLSQMGVLGILKGITKAKSGQLDTINLEGIVIDDNAPEFKECMEKIQNKWPNLIVEYDKYPISRKRQDLLMIFFKKLEEKELTLGDLFKLKEDWKTPGEEILSKEKFAEQIKKAGIDIPEDTVLKLAGQLDIQDMGMVSLGVLSTRYDEYKSGDYKPFEQVPFKKQELPKDTESPRFLPPANLATVGGGGGEVRLKRTDSAKTKRSQRTLRAEGTDLEIDLTRSSKKHSLT